MWDEYDSILGFSVLIGVGLVAFMGLHTYEINVIFSEKPGRGKEKRSARDFRGRIKKEKKEEPGEMLCRWG